MGVRKQKRKASVGSANLLLVFLSEWSCCCPFRGARREGQPGIGSSYWQVARGRAAGDRRRWMCLAGVYVRYGAQGRVSLVNEATDRARTRG